MADASLQQIDPNMVERNPDNPRLIFREAEMNQLLESIRRVGIKVPLSMYRDGNKFVLIDGERRWRCARKLNLRTVPAHVQEKPGRLENILTMFNIHNVRTQWDLMPMAIKLGEVQGLLKQEKKPAKARDLAGITGVPLPTVSRALELLELPKKYRDLLLEEAEKPKEDQTVTPDLFIELNKSKRVVQRYVPKVFEKITEEEYVDAMVSKYRAGVIDNVVHFRDISKIARAERAGGDTQASAPAILDLVTNKALPISDAYEASVKQAYDLRDLSTRGTSLSARLSALPARANIPTSLRTVLKQLQKEIARILGE